MKLLSRKTVGLVAGLIGLSLNAVALVPLEGLVLGEVAQDLQQDPMTSAFELRPEGEEYDRGLQKLYLATYRAGLELVNSCGIVGKASYANPESQTVARRTIAATLQYIGLDLTVKAIGSYAQTLQMGEDEYGKLTQNLVTESCSPNMTVYGQRLLRQNLLAAYKMKNGFRLPSFPTAPLGTPELMAKANAMETRENEFHYVVKNFRSLCSWGGDVENYRMLPPLLASPVLMSAVQRHMLGQNFHYNDKLRTVEMPTNGKWFISCDGPICRPGTKEQFQRRFPRMIGSSGLMQDVQRQWCEHFRFQNYVVGDQQTPTVRTWMKQQEPEDERKEVASMISLLTRASDLVLMSKHYSELAQDLRKPIEGSWDRWAKNSIASVSRDMYFEEPLEVRVLAQSSEARALEKSVFALDLTVTMGELDRILATKDKFQLNADLQVSHNWLRWVRSKSADATRADDNIGAREDLLEQVTAYLNDLMAKNYKHLGYFQLSGDIQRLMAQELLVQLENYQGDYFYNVSSKMVTLPVRFHYGLFALSYIRYKALLRPVPNAKPVEPNLEVAPTLTYKN